MRFPPLSSWIRGRKVVDRGQGVAPPFRPVPVPTSLYETLRFGIAYCPECHLKVSVLCNGKCRDCQPEDAA